MKTPNPVIIQIKDATDLDILASIDYYLTRGYTIKAEFDNDFPKLSAYRDKSEKNKFIIEETLNFKAINVQSKVSLGYIILRAVEQQMQSILEIEIFSINDLPLACKGTAFLKQLAIALCEEFTLVDPSKKIVFPTMDFEAMESFLREIEFNKNTDRVLKRENNRRTNYLISVLLPPWELIPDHGRDRQVLELWHSGRTGKEISKKVDLESSSVTNLISLLRIKYGTDIVPTNEQRRRVIKSKTDDSL